MAVKKPVKKAPAKRALAKRAPARGVKKVGDAYTCSVCGLGVTVDEVCGCVDTCDIICCDTPMKKKRTKR